MKMEYSPAIQFALEKAVAIASKRGSPQVVTQDLLHSLMNQEEGQPVVLVLAAGVSMENLRNLFPFIDDAKRASDLPWEETTSGILANAKKLARLHAAEGSVTSDHLLLALLEGDQASRLLLEGIGLNFGILKNRINPPAPALQLEKPFEIKPATEIVDTARILDVSANRAREAFRVLEDFARFVRGDSFLSEQLKNQRHQLAEALQRLPDNLLLHARDTIHDVGTEITTSAEQERDSPRAVVRVNAKRLQEALRSLEEYGKVLDIDFAAIMKQLRYQAYTLEQALTGRSDVQSQLAEAKLYVLLTEEMCRASLLGTVREALAGGAQIIQLREKKTDDRVLLQTARSIREMTRAAGALFIVNDRPDIALLSEADGVHLGQDDVPCKDARRILGPDALIGISTHDLVQVRRAVLEGASYIGIGPTFTSLTKQFASFPGLEFVTQVAGETSLPAFVLGGVTPGNVEQVLAAGGSRVAVSHAICAAENPKGVARKLRKILG